TVSVEEQPSQRSCVVEAGTGTITDGDASGVLVHCPTSDASLSNLVVSTGPLSPTFQSQTLAYTVRARISGVLDPAQTTIMPQANHVGTRITIGGGVVASGQSSRPMQLSFG